MLNMISYVCEDHINMLSDKGEATACPCYRLHKPKFITINSDVRKTANLFLEDAFMNEIMGNTKNMLQNNALITYQSQVEFDFFRYSTITKRMSQLLSKELYIYIDPAFTSNKRASGTGVSAICKYLNQFIILGLEHFFLESLLTSAESSIAECVSHMLLAILEIHTFFNDIYIIIEGNSNQASAVKIACLIKQNVFVQHNDKNMMFYHTIDQNNIAQPYYILSKEKRLAVEYFIAHFNSGQIKASQELISFTVKITHDPIDYLLEQIKNIHQISINDYITYTAKKQSCSDDLIISVILCVYICQDNNIIQFKPI
ncbi:hypothetical protein MRV_0080 [Murid herpesvirus 3]|uniref:Probable DNA packing protein C-terminal domain-containing protein n=2 Tax=Murid betaherpesvirus 3 TaxID=2560603 RepID=A0A1P8VIX2_9BETA|nr:hypothetical protein MRV_0080 [Murine roseolovirus]APZ76291.1 hypothetical protein MRV_0080 [Murid betaherpesvirus 3]AYH64762.1 hypothetical protein MRV_0080 [Murid herpesvirus 3]